jgi:hypothetical protein
VATWTYLFNNSHKRFLSESKSARSKNGYRLSSAAQQLLLAAVDAVVAVAVVAVVAGCRRPLAPN